MADGAAKGHTHTEHSVQSFVSPPRRRALSDEVSGAGKMRLSGRAAIDHMGALGQLELLTQYYDCNFPQRARQLRERTR